MLSTVGLVVCIRANTRQFISFWQHLVGRYCHFSSFQWYETTALKDASVDWVIVVSPTFLLFGVIGLCWAVITVGPNVPVVWCNMDFAALWFPFKQHIVTFVLLAAVNDNDWVTWGNRQKQMLPFCHVQSMSWRYGTIMKGWIVDNRGAEGCLHYLQQ